MENPQKMPANFLQKASDFLRGGGGEGPGYIAAPESDLGRTFLQNLQNHENARVLPRPHLNPDHCYTVKEACIDIKYRIKVLFNSEGLKFLIYLTSPNLFRTTISIVIRCLS
jgi:hypothetical protein